MKDDTISRQAAIDALAKFVPYAICDESTESYTNGLTDAYNLICQLPSAQPGWIPVTERLPEYGTTVLTCNQDGEYEINHIIDEEDGEWFWDGAVAWMPLTSPYREGGQE